MHTILNSKLVVSFPVLAGALWQKKFLALGTNWPLGNFPRLGPLPYFPALLIYHVTCFAL